MRSDVHPSFDVGDLRVWVTGASRGLGRAIAQGFLDSGARVAVTSRDAGVLEGAYPPSNASMVLAGSVADELTVGGMAECLDKAWGGVDVLVNCAGISPTMPHSELETLETWRSVVDINLTGAFLCARAASRMMLRDGGGSVINISSVHGQHGMARMAAYASSKGAVEALTRTLALEWINRGVRVNAVAPGYFETDMTDGLRSHASWGPQLLEKIPMRRFGKPSELVPMVVFLASPASSYVTGAIFPVDGGWSAT